MNQRKPPTEFLIVLVWCVWVFFGVGMIMWGVMIILNAFDAQHDAPAWVQAIGSVAAILIAVWVPYKQNRDKLDADRERDDEHLKKVIGVARYAAQVSVNAESYVNQENPDQQVVQKFIESLAGWESLCRTISFNEIPNVEVALGWVELINSVRDVRRNLDQFISDPAFDGRDFYTLELAKDRAEKAFLRMVQGTGALFANDNEQVGQQG